MDDRALARRFRSAALITLLLGVVGIALVWWSQKPAEALPDEFAYSNQTKLQQQQVEVLSGKMGLFSEEMSEGLKQPVTQAWIIGIGAGVIAGACFFLAYVLDRAQTRAGN